MFLAVLSFAAAVQATEPPPAPKPARKICREAPGLGTRVVRPKVCKTPEE